MKIKDRLLLEEKRIEAFEMRKNRENNRKFNKQVSELRKQEKVKDRKSNISEFSKLRKGSNSESNSNTGQSERAPKNSISNKSPKRMAMVWIKIFQVLVQIYRPFCHLGSQVRKWNKGKNAFQTK